MLTAFLLALAHCRLCAIRWVFALAIGVSAMSSAPAAMPLAGTSLQVQALATYQPTGWSQTETIRSNVVETLIAAVEVVSLAGDSWLTRAPGTHIVLPYRLSNLGNVASTVQASVSNVTSCTGSTDTLDISNLKVIVDLNGDGVADPSEPLASRFTLNASSAVSLLVVGDVPLTNPTGGACLELGVQTQLQNAQSNVSIFVSIADNPVVQLNMTSSYAQDLRPSSVDTAHYTLTATNIGTRAATTVSNSAAGKTVTVNGNAMHLVLLRAPIPVGAMLKSGSLTASHANAYKLYRVANDPPFAYRLSDPGDLSVEVALGYPVDLGVGQSLTLGFDVAALPSAGRLLYSTGEMQYSTAAGAASVLTTQSNQAQVAVAGQRLALAHQVVSKKINVMANGQSDGTITYTLALRVRNEGALPLYNLQLPHLLGGAGLMGTYTNVALPAQGQYTVVPNSLTVVQSVNSATVVNVNPSFTGQDAQTYLLSSGVNQSVLPVGAEFTLQYQVRVNAVNRANVTVLSQIAGSASLLAETSTADVADLSTDGADPDPDGDGNSNNNSIPTPLTLPDLQVFGQLASGLKISTTAAKPVRISQGVYDLTYTLTVKNDSDVNIPYVRVVDNLSCAFNPADASLNISSWSLLGPPKAQYGVLPVSSVYKPESASCNTSQESATDPSDMPFAPGVVINDASKTLAPRATETYTFTVRVTQRNLGLPSRVSNKAWLGAALDQTSQSVAISSSTTASLLVDPQGYVYDSVTRQPVRGATVTLTRQSCDGGVVDDITASQVFDGDNGLYTYSGKSMSMVTGADGQYQFFWKVPPVADICTYKLTVIPPASHALSNLLTAQNGVYGGCAYVVPDSAVPTGNMPTTWFNQFRTGYKASANPAECAVMHNNIPLDSANSGGTLLLSKQANKSQAEMGDFVDYQIKLSNRSGGSIHQITFDDVLPSGFAYVPGSSWVGGTKLPDPIYKTNSTTRRTSLSYELGKDNVLADKADLTVRYRLRIGVGAVSDTDAINTALATAVSTSAPVTLTSNTAQARVRISGGVFGTQGFALGKVWADCNRNGLQDDEHEPGIPGVRLYMEDGTSVITDHLGRWSLYGLKPITHVLRVDLSTLPTGSKLALLDNRQAGQAHSRFLDLKNGELVRADFALSGCDAASLLSDIEQRQTTWAQAADQQLQALVSARLPTESRIAPAGDLRGQPSSGVVGGTGPAVGFALPQPENLSVPLISAAPHLIQGPGASNMNGGITPALSPRVGQPATTSTSNSMSDSLLGPLAALSSVPLENVIENLTPQAAFIELKDADTLLSNQINVRVTGPLQAQLRLIVNDQVEPETRIGKKAVVTKTGLVAAEYIAVQLKPGLNTLRVEALDEFGNVRQQAQIRVKAPGELGRIQLQPRGRLSADPMRPLVIDLKLTDAAGIPISARTAITLEAQGAQWLTKDLNPDEPGVQLFVENGQAELHIQPPAQQDLVPVRVSSGRLIHQEVLQFLPALTPMQGIGIVDGVLDLSKTGRLSLTQPQASNAFEQEITGITKESGDTRAAARSAFYFKGTIKGEYLLTAAYDSDKAKNDRLFRDIRPDEFYPVYGDAAVRGFDAQSSAKLYVRIDKNRSFLLLGDFNTASSAEVRQISQYSRALNGVQHRYQDDNTRITSFHAQTNATQQVEEIPANGLSFYNLSGVVGEIRSGSEKVELIVRDRSQPNIVLSTRALVRLVDYSFEPLTRRLALVQPLPSFDANFNPQSIRVTYEFNLGGPTYKVQGTDVQVKATENLQIGAVAVRDENPANQRKLQAVTGLSKLNDTTILSAEAAQTDTDLKGVGRAERVTLRHDSGDLKAQAQIVKSATNFDNLSSTTAAGRTEATAQAEYALTSDTRLRTEAYTSRDTNLSTVTTTTGERKNVGVAVAHKFNEQWAAEVGLRHGNSTGNGAAGFSYSQVSNNNLGSGIGNLGNMAAISSVQTPSTSTTARARLTARPESLPRLQMFGEVEQDVDVSERKALTAGASYGLTDKTRLYAQRAFTSTLSEVASVNGQNLRNATVVGIDSAYMEGGRVYNEYRAMSQVAPQNASGVRNTFSLGDWRLTGGLERVQTVGANPTPASTPGISPTAAGASATALALGVDWGKGPWRLSSALERRMATTSNASLYSVAGAWRMQDDLTLLARLIDTQTKDNTNRASNLIQRQQLGSAWRPAYADRWNILSRYEHRVQDVSAGNSVSTDPFGASVANTSLGRSETHILSTHGHWQIDRQQALSLRWAGKTTNARDAAASSRYWAYLVHGRYTRDLTQDWDVGFQTGYLTGKGGANQKTLGLEVGYQLVPSLWLSMGYNVLGLTDPDLSGQNYTSRGAYVRLRWKFDEAVFQFGNVAEK
jgi:large repetitive protein